MSHLHKTTQAVIECDGTTQCLGDFLNDGDFRHWIIHYLAGSADIHFGFTDTTAEDSHVFRLPPNTAPFQMEFERVSMKPSQIFFKGTNGDTFSIGAVGGRY